MSRKKLRKDRQAIEDAEQEIDEDLQGEISRQVGRRDFLKKAGALAGVGAVGVGLGGMLGHSMASPGAGAGGTTITDEDIDAKRIGGVRYAADFITGTVPAGTDADPYPGTAIQAAIDDLGVEGGTVYIAQGNWDLISGLTIATGGISSGDSVSPGGIALVGAGDATTILRAKTASIIMLDIGATGADRQGNHVRDLRLDGDSLAVTGIRLRRVGNSRFQNIWFRNIVGIGVQFSDRNYFNIFSHCRFDNVGDATGLLPAVDFEDNENANVLQYCWFEPMPWTGIRFRRIDASTLQDNIIDGCYLAGLAVATIPAIDIRGAEQTKVINNLISVGSTSRCIIVRQGDGGQNARRNCIGPGNRLQPESTAGIAIIVETGTNETVINGNTFTQGATAIQIDAGAGDSIVGINLYNSTITTPLSNAGSGTIFADAAGMNLENLAHVLGPATSSTVLLLSGRRTTASGDGMGLQTADGAGGLLRRLSIEVGSGGRPIRVTNGTLYPSDAVSGIGVRTKAGIPSDADFDSPVDGLIVIDTSNNRLYYRRGGTWHYVAETA